MKRKERVKGVEKRERDRDGEIFEFLDGCMFFTTESNEQLFFCI